MEEQVRVKKKYIIDACKQLNYSGYRAVEEDEHSLEYTFEGLIMLFRKNGYLATGVRIIFNKACELQQAAEHTPEQPVSEEESEVVEPAPAEPASEPQPEAECKNEYDPNQFLYNDFKVHSDLGYLKAKAVWDKLSHAEALIMVESIRHYMNAGWLICKLVDTRYEVAFDQAFESLKPESYPFEHLNNGRE